MNAINDKSYEYKFLRVPLEIGNLFTGHLNVGEHLNILNVYPDFEYWSKFKETLIFRKKNYKLNSVCPPNKKYEYEFLENKYLQFRSRELNYNFFPNENSNYIFHRDEIYLKIFSILYSDIENFFITITNLDRFSNFLSISMKKNILYSYGLVMVKITGYLEFKTIDNKYISEETGLNDIEIDDMEMNILNELNFSIIPTTVYDFILIISNKYSYDKEKIETLKALAIISLFDKDISKEYPSKIAEACVYLIDSDIEYTYPDIFSLSSKILSIIFKNYNSFSDYLNPNFDLLKRIRSGKNYTPIAFTNSKVNENFEYFSSYDLVSKIGEGTFGNVYEGLSQKFGKIAVKINKFEDKYLLIREISILREVSHENILQIYDLTLNQNNNIVIITEYLDSNLYTVILNTKLDIEQINTIFYYITKGLNYLHLNGIIHRDLSHKNILLNYDFSKIKIADFGASKYTTSFQSLHSSGITTLQYRAPEIFLNVDEYSYLIDVWALGIVFLGLINSGTENIFPINNSKIDIEVLFLIFYNLGTPNLNRNKYENVAKILDTNFDGFPLSNFMEIKDNAFEKLLCKMLSIDPEYRCGTTELLQEFN